MKKNKNRTDGKKIELSKGEITIGFDPQRGVFIKDESTTVVHVFGPITAINMANKLLEYSIAALGENNIAEKK